MTQEDKANPENKTGFLNSPDALPMSDRPARPQTKLLGPLSRVQFKIGDKKVPLDLKSVIIVGRSSEEDERHPGLDLAPFDAYQHGVSRQHAAITQHEGSLYIEDLGSTNGTRINGFQLVARRKYRLRDGDEVEIGRIRTLVQFIDNSEG